MEQVVAVSVMGLALATALGAVGTGALAQRATAFRDDALALAEAQMEYVKSQPFSAAPATYPLGVTAPSGFSLSTTSQTLPSTDSHVERVQVTVLKNGVVVGYLEGYKVSRP